MYKKNDILKTKRGLVRILATRTESHLIGGAHPFLNIGDELFPDDEKDYILEIENPNKNDELPCVYLHVTEYELDSIMYKVQ